MTTVLHLTAKERLAFESLPADLRAGAEIVEETLTFKDSDAHRMARVKAVKIEHPSLRMLIQKAKMPTNHEELADFVRQLDLSEASERDAVEICFLLGADGMTELLFQQLAQTGAPEEVEFLGALTFLRHSFLESVQPVASPLPHEPRQPA